MNVRLVLVALLFLSGGLIALQALQWRFGLGDFVTSPQQIVIPLEARMIVGGGRAGVELVQRRDDLIHLVVRCLGEQQRLKLRRGEISDEVCTVRIQLVEISSVTGTLATSQAHLEVTWGP